MFFSKAILMVTMVCASVVASAQVVGQGGGQVGGRAPRASAPCRLKPALFYNLNGNRDYGVQLIIGKRDFRRPMSMAQGETLYAQFLNERICIPPRNLLNCSVISTGARRAIQFIYPTGRVETIQNNLGGIDPQYALNNYRQAGICN